MQSNILNNSEDGHEFCFMVSCIKSFLNNLRNKGYAKTSINKRRQVVEPFIKWIGENN